MVVAVVVKLEYTSTLLIFVERHAKIHQGVSTALAFSGSELSRKLFGQIKDVLGQINIEGFLPYLFDLSLLFLLLRPLFLEEPVDAPHAQEDDAADKDYKETRTSVSWSQQLAWFQRLSSAPLWLLT